MGSTVRFRSTSTRAIGAATIGFAVVACGSLLLSGGWSHVPTYGALAALLGLVGWAALWQPYVEISDGGVVLANVTRTIRLPWPAIHDVDGRFGLRLDTAYGRFTGWAAPAPVGRARAKGLESEAAALVRQRLEALRSAGHLEDPRLESDRPDVAWHVKVLAGAAGLVLVALLGALLG